MLPKETSLRIPQTPLKRIKTKKIKEDEGPKAVNPGFVISLTTAVDSIPFDIDINNSTHFLLEPLFGRSRVSEFDGSGGQGGENGA